MTQAVLSEGLLAIEPNLRYVAVNRNGRISEMVQNSPTHNPAETDRLEELIVNPVILELAERRGRLDLGGALYVIIRYGPQYQAIFHYGDGHVSIGIDLDADPVRVVEAVHRHLGLEGEAFSRETSIAN
ncbi:MAG: hypothetical protein V3R73_00285 [Sphingomonadales bacterium]